MTEKLSARFTKVFSDLPPEAQQTLLEKSLADVLDQLPSDVAKKVYSSALKVQTKHQNVPKLDLRGKRKEVNALLDLFNRENKMSMFGDRTRREEIVSETIQSLTGWLNDVWSAFYEHRVQHTTAHACLLFVSEALGQLEATPTPGGCKCELMNLPIRITIRDKHGECMTKLRVRGPTNVDRLLLWIWRDLCLCILARGLKEDRKRVKDILYDLESIYGFPVLERLLLGPDDEQADEDDAIFLEDDSYSDMDDDPNDFFMGILRGDFRSAHWKGKFEKESQVLQSLVEDFLFELFTVAPSLQVYDAIIGIAQNVAQAKLKASGILYDVAGNSSDNLVGALNIEVAKNNAPRILSLLDQYSYLLRSRDAVTLQCAASVLGDSTYHARGLSLLATGLEETLVAIQVAVQGAFRNIDDPTNRQELTDILKLRVGHPNRRDRIDSWVQAISSSSSTGMGPMAFAAMMFGIPMMAGMPGMPGMVDDADDQADILSFIDSEGSGDADMDDLREDFRPKLKERFEGWSELAGHMKGGSVVAAKAYVKVLELMPYMRGADVVTEMVNRLAERPGKGYICDALEAVSSFCKTQSKKLRQAKNAKDKQAKNKSAAAAASGASSRSTSAAAAPNDSDSDSDGGPPPLIPASTPAPAANNAPAPPTANSSSFFSFSIPFPLGSSSNPSTPSTAQPTASPSQPTQGPSTSAPSSAPQPPPSAQPFRLFEGMEDVD
ncbi:hypothetical protein NMY22_g366 [Coprinellus aureogranulatus]|nr:hypothetical protein NMY22_g366 [Coprinellus aureogranulatus]